MIFCQIVFAFNWRISDKNNEKGSIKTGSHDVKPLSGLFFKYMDVYGDPLKICNTRAISNQMQS